MTITVPDERETRELIGRALEADGRPDKAFLASEPTSAIMRRSGVLPGGAELLRFDAFPHPGASFYVGVVGKRVFYLTGSPGAFTAMTRAAGLRIASPADALAVARSFAETTRTMNVFTRVVDDVDDIEWASGPLAPGPEEIGALVDRLRGLIAPPSVEARGDDHVVTLFVLRGAVLERRTLAISGNGGVQVRTDQVAEDLPVPISR